jgi:hypothetical protein
MALDARQKSILVGAGLFVLTLGWAFFLDQMGVTPDFLLTSIGNVRILELFFSVAFAGFAILFSTAIGLITAYADKDDRTRVYVATFIPSLLASAVSAILFTNFAQWYPLALFYFGCIPLMIETARLKRMELKNFATFRSSYSGAKRGIQIIGVGVLVTLAVTALPQSSALYDSFESSLFAGKVVQQLDVQKITADFLITTQKNTLNQVVSADAFMQLRDNTDPEVQAFVQLMDATIQNVDSSEYRNKIIEQVTNQQEKLDTQALLSQIQNRVPGYSALREYYWALSAVLGGLIFFAVASFVLQPLSAIFGSVIYAALPDGHLTRNAYVLPEPVSGGWATPETTPVQQTGWDAQPEEAASISSQPDAQPAVPTYTHVDEPAQPQ